MRTRNEVFAAAGILIGLPLVLILLALAAFFTAMSFYAPHRTNGSIVSSGEKRQYLLHVPKSYDRARPTPLVISMHDAALWPATQMEASQWSRAADEHGFIVVYPWGSDMPTIWHVERGARLIRDVRFISELIDTLKAAYNIDPSRIYADGLSNGGGMAFVLSCTLSDRIAAVGMVSAAQSLPWSWCTDPRPVPMMVVHGTADPITPFNGGRSPVALDLFPSIPTWTANWARRNSCAPNPVESAEAADVTRLEYTNCADGAAVVFYTVKGGGHAWPGGRPLPVPEWIVGPTRRSLDATRQLWAFYRDHPLRAK